MEIVHVAIETYLSMAQPLQHMLPETSPERNSHEHSPPIWVSLDLARKQVHAHTVSLCVATPSKCIRFG